MTGFISDTVCWFILAKLLAGTRLEGSSTHHDRNRQGRSLEIPSITRVTALSTYSANPDGPAAQAGLVRQEQGTAAGTMLFSSV